MIRRSNTDICSIDVPQDEEYLALVRDLLEHPKVGLMREYIQHGDTTCLEHCVNVSYLSYLFCKSHGLDARAAARRPNLPRGVFSCPLPRLSASHA